jgi:proline dehydrogenase
MGIARNLLLYASKNPWLRENLPRFRFARKAVQRFMPGEEVSAAIEAASRFQPEGISAVLTYLGENVTDTQHASGVAQHYCDVLRMISEAGINCEVSVKLTQLGHDINPEVSFANVSRVIEAAARANNYIWIDMEESRYVDSTLDVYRRLHKEHPNTGVCLQSYLYRTVDDLESLLPLRPGIRLVKGAYKEPPDRAFPKKRDVDENFFRLSERLLGAAKEKMVRPGFATHDARLVQRIQHTAQVTQVPADTYEFQMLYGIRTELLRSLVRSGHHCRILISYGPAWFPWYMRRLAERPANVLFVLRNVWS